MRWLLLASAALLSAPAAAQDHSGHEGHGGQEGHGDHAGHAPPPTPPAEPAADVHTGHGADHGAMDHSQMDHSQMDHGAMNHGAMDHAEMDHSQHGAMDHSAHGAMPADPDIPFGPPPPAAFSGPQHAADAIWGREAMGPARRYNHAMHGDQRFGLAFAERLEVRLGGEHDKYLWDLQSWYGTATNRVFLKSEGEGEFGGSLESAEVQLLWSNAIGPWFDLQAGVRVDAAPDPTGHLVLGVQGLTPYMIHVDAAAFLSIEGDLTARVEAEHDMRLTQQLVLQPRVEAELSAQDIPERGVGVGISKIETGLRLRYEFVPEFAPYIGVEYEAATGRTADYLRAEGEDADGIVFLIGLRTWF